MLSLEEIKSYYPESMKYHSRFILREYLQYKILEIIFNSKHADALCFMGGTCLRIVHGNRRFSEDLDFDNIGIDGDGFREIAGEILSHLEREGYHVEIKTTMPGAWHCYIRFPKLLFREGLSGYEEEKILIQVDTEPQNYSYEPDRVILNRFEVFTTILTAPLPLLLAQKFYAIINRPRNKGRDFYDVVFLMGKGVLPEFSYLKEKAGISNTSELKDKVLNVCNKTDMFAMAADVEPFLFDSADRKKVLMFCDYLQASFH
ncbi:nucleotidyl transferase AbiEii/AbiGii toxin family protein [candidate division KSB1 bacterium]|nr:MAG: nucleotidyl transferase AbiEii/AbiGii toxin family protein [candidate division KSB1 bacterium]